MRELLKLFVMRYGSTRVEVAMEMKFVNKNSLMDRGGHLQLFGPRFFVASYISDGGWGYGG
jgi:hypothetical protein